MNPPLPMKDEDSESVIRRYLSIADRDLDEPDFKPPPKTVNLIEMMPYLFSMANGLRKMRWRLVAAIAAMMISKAAGLSVPILFKQAVDALSSSAPGTLSQAAIMTATTAIVLSGVGKLISGAAKELQMVVFTPLAQAVGRQVAFHTFRHLLSLDTQFHLEHKTGSLARVLERGTRSVYMIFRSLVFTFIPTAVELILVCGLLAKAFNPLVAGIVVLTFVIYVVATTKLTMKVADMRKDVNVIENETSAKTVDALLNYETVTLFGNAKLETHQYNRYLRAYHVAGYDSEVMSCSLNAAQASILAIGVTAVLAVGILSCASGTMTVGDVVMANALLLQLWAPLQFLGWFYRELRQSLVDMEHLSGILNTSTRVPDGTLPLPDNKGPRRGVSIEVSDLHFSYPNNRHVLRGLSVSIEPGESVAFVGPSGSGKSTLLRLVLRSYDPDRGTVRLNGVDARDLQQSTVRDVTAVVPQDTLLFNGTVLDNIEYGRPGSSREAVEAAAKAAQLHDAIMRMPQGYDTVVGERGLKLSGGEKQRCAIARAFLRDPELLICDEATSALDSATEAGIMASLQLLSQGRTSLFVAHRLSTVKHCDKIVVMKDGMVVEVGNHQQLMAKGGTYASMWALQREEGEIPDDASADSVEFAPVV